MVCGPTLPAPAHQQAVLTCVCSHVHFRRFMSHENVLNMNMGHAELGQDISWPSISRACMFDMVITASSSRRSRLGLDEHLLYIYTLCKGGNGNGSPSMQS